MILFFPECITGDRSCHIFVKKMDWQKRINWHIQRPIKLQSFQTTFNFTKSSKAVKMSHCQWNRIMFLLLKQFVMTEVVTCAYELFRKGCLLNSLTSYLTEKELEEGELRSDCDCDCMRNAETSLSELWRCSTRPKCKNSAYDAVWVAHEAVFIWVGGLK
jgi:hypothetical protein